MFDNLPADSKALLLGFAAVVAALIGNTLLKWIRVAIASRHQREMVSVLFFLNWKAPAIQQPIM